MGVLAIDQGTSSTRAMLFSEDGTVRTIHSERVRQNHPRADWIEQDGQALLASIETALSKASAAGPVRGVGLANQGESCLAWDAESGEAAGPVIGWQDSRTRAATERLIAEGCAGEIRARSGLPLDPYFSASKLGWLVAENPRLRSLAAKGRLRLGTTDAFFRDRLTGRFETDVATASRTGLLNLHSLQWDEELCRLFAVPREALPAITDNNGDLGTIRIGGHEVPFVASIVDQQASLYGHGCRTRGEAKITFGTGAFALAISGGPVMDAAALPTVAWRRSGETALYAADAAVSCASSAVDWARSLGIAADMSRFDDPFAETAVGRGLIFVPALAGLATPHWDRKVRGAWFGLGLDTSAEDMIRAVLEGVAFAAAEAIETLTAFIGGGAGSAPLSIDGGMSRNRYFCQFFADILDRRLLVSATTERTALGTALLAAEALGETIALPQTGPTVSPRAIDPKARQAYDDARRLAGQFGK